jgi:hypothetical protein
MESPTSGVWNCLILQLGAVILHRAARTWASPQRAAGSKNFSSSSGHAGVLPGDIAPNILLRAGRGSVSCRTRWT